MRRRVLLPVGIVVAVAAAVAIPLFAVGGGSSPSGSAEAVLTEALNSAQVAGSVHFVDHTSSGGQEQVIQGVISAPTAAETVSGAAVPLEVELIDGVVYVNGGAAVLSGTLGLSAADAAADAGKWISVHSGDEPFDSLTQVLVLSATLDEFTPVTHVKLGKVQDLGGHHVLPITGVPASSVTNGVAADAALLVSVAAPHLPVAGTLVMATKSARLQEEAVFTNWGAKIVLQPPASAVAYSSIDN